MNALHNIVWIRRLIWVYLGLFVFEGAIRKWLLPQLSGPLLMVRDPVVIAIYILTFQAKIFPKGAAVTAIVFIAILSLFAGLMVLQESPAVVLFGFQAQFLHLPLLFIIPRVFDAADVRKVGYWALIMSIPLALLMVAQFHAAPDAWLNKGAGEGTSQLATAMGHVRASATFSYITGPVLFYSVVTAFLFHHIFAGRQYPTWLVAAAAVATVVAAAVAGSRSLVLAVGTVTAFAMFIGVFLQPQFMRTVRIVFLLILVALIVPQLTIFQEGLQVLNARVEESNSTEGGMEGTFQTRILSGFTTPFEQIASAPTLGLGLGLGTVGGAVLRTGNAAWTSETNWENEWVRNIFEVGPLLGLAFIIYRVSLTVFLGWFAFVVARRGNPLPLLLFAAAGNDILIGNFGQATGVGFAVIASGLCLTAMAPSRATAFEGERFAAHHDASEVAS